MFAAHDQPAPAPPSPWTAVATAIATAIGTTVATKLAEWAIEELKDRRSRKEHST